MGTQLEPITTPDCPRCQDARMVSRGTLNDGRPDFIVCPKCQGAGKPSCFVARVGINAKTEEQLVRLADLQATRMRIRASLAAGAESDIELALEDLQEERVEITKRVPMPGDAMALRKIHRAITRLEGDLARAKLGKN